MTPSPPPPQLPPAAAHVLPGKVSLVVLNWNAQPFLDRCLRSVVRHTREPYELVVVDNGSADGSKDYIRRFMRTHPTLDITFLDHAENLYFSRGFNLGFMAGARDAEYVMVLCNDVEVKEDGWLDELIAAMRAPRVIAAGHAQPGCRVSAEQREVFRRAQPRYDDADLERRMRAFMDTPGAAYTHLFGYCFLLRRGLLERTGLYLEAGDFKQYHSDWEWYVRFHVLGFDIAAAPPKVHHWHSISELVAFHPHLYRDLVDKIADPAVAARYLREGRPLYEAESGYRELQRHRREDERGGDEG